MGGGASRAAKKRAKRKGLPPPEALPAAAKRQAAPVVEPLLHKRREAAFAAEPPEQRKKKKRSGGGSFQVVPVGYTAQARGGGGGDAGSKASQNTLRQAQVGALGSTGSAAARKADEIWFRKCGHGELLFTAYYRGQGLVPPGEWPAFLAALRRPLPLTFRVHGAPSEARASLLTRLERLPSVEPVSWAPRALGIWQAVGGLDKRAAAANAQVAANAFAAAGLPNTRGADGAESLAEVLADGVRAGLLNRQEAVSMLPVLALRVPAGASCLDMCASPGSKTMQLLEAVSAGSPPPAAAADDDDDDDDDQDGAQDSGGGGGEAVRLAGAAGLVMANDAHPKRV